MRKLIYFCPESIASIAKNSIEQAKAIAAQGVNVDFLCPHDWPGEYPDSVRMHAVLNPGPKPGIHTRPISRLLGVRKIMGNNALLSDFINKADTRGGQKPRVMFGSFFEYLAPFWVPKLDRFRRTGVVFGATALDPIRDHIVGPTWWHRASVEQAYALFREVFVHQAVDLALSRPLPEQRVTEVPHGPYDYPAWPDARSATRKELGLTEDAKVFLSFGHLRENKNLALVLEALREMPDNVFLLVVGPEAAPGRMSSGEYKELARSLGVEHKVRWAIRYVSDEEVNKYFGAADFSVMTYSRTFRSTSGALHIAAPLRMPVLVSCGDAPLGSLVTDYNLGLRVEPDSVSEIVRGMRLLLASPFSGGWDRFMAYFTYEENARIVIEKLFEDR
jgi:glycosyltransferase involved in cell wall biosynthesis